jgi:hypothetical protein
LFFTSESYYLLFTHHLTEYKLTSVIKLTHIDRSFIPSFRSKIIDHKIFTRSIIWKRKNIHITQIDYHIEQNIHIVFVHQCKIKKRLFWVETDCLSLNHDDSAYRFRWIKSLIEMDRLFMQSCRKKIIVYKTFRGRITWKRKNIHTT